MTSAMTSSSRPGPARRLAALPMSLLLLVRPALANLPYCGDGCASRCPCTGPLGDGGPDARPRPSPRPADAAPAPAIPMGGPALPMPETGVPWMPPPSPAVPPGAGRAAIGSLSLTVSFGRATDEDAELDGLNGNAATMRHAWQPFDVGLDVILATIDISETFYFLHDANKNVMEKTTDNGTLSEKYAYTPFGLNISAFNPGIGFSSEVNEISTETSYYIFRDYIGRIGRWNTKDLVGELADKNLYSFCKNASVLYYDRLGYIFSKECVTGKVRIQGKWILGGIESIDNNDLSGSVGGSVSSGIKVQYLRNIDYEYICTCSCPKQQSSKYRRFTYKIEKEFDFSVKGHVIWRGITPAPWSPVPTSPVLIDLIGDLLSHYINQMLVLNPDDMEIISKMILANTPSPREVGNLDKDTGVPTIFCLLD